MTFDPVAIRAWRVRLVTWFPKTLLSDMSKGMPDKLEFGTRVGKSSANVNGVSVSLGPATPAAEDSADLIAPDPGFLTFDVAAVGAVDAVEVAQPVIDTVIDDLSFQLQEPLRISSMTVLDLTPPVTAGDEREFMQYTGYDQFKLSRSTAMGTTHTVLVPSLRANYAELSRRTQDALDWYIKAMHTPWDADRYIFYWVSFEILRAELGEKVEEPTRLRCTHQIAFCPTCGKPTTQYRQGAATYKFLESFGIPADVAKALWDMRHIVHGAKSFDRERLARLGELLQILRAVTAAALRVAMGIPDDAPPFVSYGAVAFGAPMGVGGIRQVTDNDLA